MVIHTFSAVAALLLVSGENQQTDFGIRVPPGVPADPRIEGYLHKKHSNAVSIDLNGAAGLGSRWGVVTSTKRTVARNRAVGGAPNSFHLSGRAIDIARRPGVRHAEIEAAYRNAGYRLIESLDEGDHSHFAFSARIAPPKVIERPAVWKIVYSTR